jgi:hypothetical protein
MARRMLSGESVPLVSVLPPSPADGQVIDYVADSANGVIWRFRYRAASASTYKWELVGGSPLESANLTNAQTPGGGTFFSTTLTDGDRIVAVALPLAGDYLAEWNAMVGHAATVTTSPAIGVYRPNAGEPNTPSGGYQQTTAYGSGALHTLSGRSRLNGCVVGNAAMAYLYTSQIEIFYQRRLAITPVRVG